MKVELANTAGFCFGVKRAVEMVYEQAEKHKGERVYTFGPIIHNEEVIKDMEERGVSVIHSVEELEDLKDGTVIIRSHGEGQAVHQRLREMGREVADATCVKVTKIHRIVEEASRRGRQVIIIGEAEHPEVKAIAGWCQGARVFREKRTKTTKNLLHWFPKLHQPIKFGAHAEKK